MRQSLIFAAGLMLAVGALVGCGGGDASVRDVVTPKPANRASLALADGSRPSVHVEMDPLSFEVPAHWERMDDPGDFTLAAWRFRDDAGRVGMMRLSVLSGDQASGDLLLANVNRWEGQLGLVRRPTAAGLLGPPIATANGTARVIDIKSPVDVIGLPARFRIAMLPVVDAQGQVRATYFLKLEGSHGTVEDARQDFSALLTSLGLSAPPPMMSAPALPGDEPVAQDSAEATP